MRIIKPRIVGVLVVLAWITGSVCEANNEKIKSYHVGFFYPNGVDMVGHTTETPLHRNWYWYYTFGFPSLVAAGLCLYQDYSNNGMVLGGGVGIGSVAYGSIAYQRHIKSGHYVKLGVGVTTSIVYTGFYPALSYEHRY